MPLTAAAAAELTKLTKRVGYTVELATHHAESSGWMDFPIERDSISFVHAPGSPARVTVNVVDAELAHRLESDPANRCQQFALARVTVHVGSESEVRLLGRVQQVTLDGPHVRLVLEDWGVLANECDCVLDVEPDAVDVVSASATRQLVLIEENLWGLALDGTGTDPAYKAADQTASGRRSWVPDDIRVWRDAAQAEEVPPSHWQVYTEYGVVKLLEDTNGNSYYVSGVACYLETGAPGAADMDYATILKRAFMFPAADGGAGLSEGDLDIPATGFDLCKPYRYDGSLRDFVEDVLAAALPHCRYWFNSATGKHTIRPVIQKPPANVDWALLAAQRVEQPRSTAKLATRVVVTGKDDQPVNLLAEADTSFTPGETGECFAWERLNGGDTCSFSDGVANLHSGDPSLGFGIHNLTGTLEQLYSDSNWRVLCTADAGAVFPTDGIRAVLPPSYNRFADNAKHPDEDTARFWPGLKILLSVDGIRWRLASLKICGRYRPASTVEAFGDDLIPRSARYLRVLCLPYKQGASNHTDPAMGLMELEWITSLEYKIDLKIDPNATPATYYTYSNGAQWQRNHPGLATRLGGRTKTVRRDLGGEYSEYRARDIAIQTIAEAVRLYQQVEFRAVCDPRVHLYDSVSVPDPYNGAVPSILVEQVQLAPRGDTFTGTNYLAGPPQ